MRFVLLLLLLYSVKILKINIYGTVLDGEIKKNMCFQK